MQMSMRERQRRSRFHSRIPELTRVTITILRVNERLSKHFFFLLRRLSRGHGQLQGESGKLARQQMFPWNERTNEVGFRRSVQTEREEKTLPPCLRYRVQPSRAPRPSSPPAFPFALESANFRSMRSSAAGARAPISALFSEPRVPNFS